MAELVGLDGVTAGYGGSVVLDDVSLALDEGDSLALLGRNGVGKTTLLVTLMGLTRVHGGALRWRGGDLAALSTFQRAQAGIGCHAMATWMDRDTAGLIQMGGEGVNWAASSRFTGRGHIFQNLGEGTWYHSGSMAVRQAVAAGANITYKILYNDAVAMTGGQPVDGQLSVPQITHQLYGEGVKKIVDAVIEVCRSGNVGDGKIFISDVKDAIRIRTKEKGTEVTLPSLSLTAIGQARLQELSDKELADLL